MLLDDDADVNDHAAEALQKQSDEDIKRILLSDDRQLEGTADVKVRMDQPVVVLGTAGTGS